MKPGYYPHTKGSLQGKYEWWDGTKWEGKGRVYDTPEQVQEVLAKSKQPVQPQVQQPQQSTSKPFGLGKKSPAQSQTSKYFSNTTSSAPFTQPSGIPQGGFGLGKRQNAQTNAATPEHAVPHAEDDADTNSDVSLDDFAQPEKEGKKAKSGKKSKPKRKKWPIVLISIAVLLILIGSMVVAALNNRPAIPVKGSAQVDMSQVGKPQSQAMSAKSDNNTLSKEQLLQKAEEAEKEGNSSKAEYYKALAENVKEQDTQDNSTQSVEPAYVATAKEIGNMITQKQCPAAKEKYGKDLESWQFNCDGFTTDRGNKGKDTVMVQSYSTSPVTGYSVVYVTWGNDKDKTQNARITFDSSDNVTSMEPVKNK